MSDLASFTNPPKRNGSRTRRYVVASIVFLTLSLAATQIFLQWFVNEQVEEEKSAQEIIDRLRMVSDRPGSVLYLDKEYGKRGKAA